MSTASRDKKQANDPGDEPVVVFYPPLKPQRKLMLISGGILAAWLITLLVLYFSTIAPARKRMADRQNNSPVQAVDPGMAPPTTRPAPIQTPATTPVTVPR